MALSRPTEHKLPNNLLNPRASGFVIVGEVQRAGRDDSLSQVIDTNSIKSVELYPTCIPIRDDIVMRIYSYKNQMRFTLSTAPFDNFLIFEIPEVSLAPNKIHALSELLSEFVATPDGRFVIVLSHRRERETFPGPVPDGNPPRFPQRMDYYDTYTLYCINVETKNVTSKEVLKTSPITVHNECFIISYLDGRPDSYEEKPQFPQYDPNAPELFLSPLSNTRFAVSGDDKRMTFSIEKQGELKHLKTEKKPHHQSMETCPYEKYTANLFAISDSEYLLTLENCDSPNEFKHVTTCATQPEYQFAPTGELYFSNGNEINIFDPEAKSSPIKPFARTTSTIKLLHFTPLGELLVLTENPILLRYTIAGVEQYKQNLHQLTKKSDTQRLVDILFKVHPQMIIPLCRIIQDYVQENIKPYDVYFPLSRQINYFCSFQELRSEDQKAVQTLTTPENIHAIKQFFFFREKHPQMPIALAVENACKSLTLFKDARKVLANIEKHQTLTKR